MRIIYFLLFCLLICSCTSDKLEIPKAKEIVEKLIVTIDKEDYNALSELYSPDFIASEPIEERNKKLKTLKDLMGGIKSIELTDSLNEAKSGEQARILLTYRIHREKVNSVESFTVTYEEGSYRVSGHSVKSENL